MVLSLVLSWHDLQSLIYDLLKIMSKKNWEVFPGKTRYFLSLWFLLCVCVCVCVCVYSCLFSPVLAQLGKVLLWWSLAEWPWSSLILWYCCRNVHPSDLILRVCVSFILNFYRNSWKLSKGSMADCWYWRFAWNWRPCFAHFPFHVCDSMCWYFACFKINHQFAR